MKTYDLRLEIGNHCNLRCPLCLRQSPVLDKNVLNRVHLSLNDVKKFLPRFFLTNQIKSVLISGSSSEPTMNSNLINIVKYLIKYNSNIIVDSNGSTRNIDWWAELGATGVQCDFAPDSIKPNNNKYRINSNTDKVIENMQAFISAGGTARWKFIPYAHNQDELEEQRTISKSIGATFFVAQPFTVRNRTEKVEDSDLFPKDHKLVRYTENSTPHHYCKILGEIQNLLEISAEGIVYPCTFSSRQLYYVYGDYFVSGNTTPKVNFEYVKGWTENLDSFIESFVPLIEDQGGIETLSLHHYSITEILNSPFYKNTLKQSWSNKEHFCNKHCNHVKYSDHLDYVLNKN